MGCELDCKICYYHNYYSIDHTCHFYSSSIPQFIQIEDHAYVKAGLCELFSTFMLFAWVSSQNCGNILNTVIKRRVHTKELGTLSISSEQVSHAFYLNALLHDCAEHGEVLVLLDVGDNDDRLKLAMEAQNKHIISEGQVERMHACSKCERFLPRSGYNNLCLYLFHYFYCPLTKNIPGSFRAVITDGITIGRPCCKVHNCTQPLPNNHAHFCLEHAALKKVCIVVGCNAKATKGFQTCAEISHRELEDTRKDVGKAFFQLRHLIQRHNMPHLSDSMTTPHPHDFDHDADDGSRKSDSGNQQPKAHFSRRQTHNEQLVVSCCGIILACGTMFGAEAISGVKVIYFI